MDLQGIKNFFLENHTKNYIDVHLRDWRSKSCIHRPVYSMANLTVILPLQMIENTIKLPFKLLSFWYAIAHVDDNNHKTLSLVVLSAATINHILWMPLISLLQSIKSLVSEEVPLFPMYNNNNTMKWSEWNRSSVWVRYIVYPLSHLLNTLDIIESESPNFYEF